MSSGKSDMRDKNGGKKLKKVIIIILAVLLAIILAMLCALGILHMAGKHQFSENDKNISINSDIDVEIEIDDNAVYYNDKKYVLDTDVVSILLMGIDKRSINDLDVQGLNGQADTIVVAALNLRDKSIKMIPIPRETMTDVSIYNTKGEYVETKRQQICLAYAYGDTAESSGKNVVTSVSRVLYGISIDSYVSIDIDGVSAMCDAVGGINVTSLEDLKSTYYDIKKGDALKLKGDLARFYIQARGDDAEASMRRLQRQKQFMSAFATTAGNQILSDFTKLAKLYSTAQPYINTDLSLAQITYLATNLLRADIGQHMNYISVNGDLKLNQNTVEFIPDEEALLDTVIDVFYKEAE